MASRSVLVVLSGSSEIDLKGGKVRSSRTTEDGKRKYHDGIDLMMACVQTEETGFFLSELYAPLSILEKAGYRYLISNSSINLNPGSSFRQQAHLHQPIGHDAQYGSAVRPHGASAEVALSVVPVQQLSLWNGC